jgi:uncharacterized protein (TIGR03435 family)
VRPTGLVVAFVTLGLVAAAAAQQKTFDAVSVKRFDGDAFLRPITLRPGQLYAAATPARELVQAAYGVERNQVIDGPRWVDTTLFEVNAAIARGSTITDVQLMLRALLVERFGLVTHQEQRELPVYVLVDGGKAGPQLKVSGTECREVTSPAGVPMPPPPPVAPSGFESVTVLNQPRSEGRCPSMFFPGYMSVRSLPMSFVALHLSRLLRRQVVDRTGMEGAYDFDLTYAPEADAEGVGAVGAVGGPLSGPAAAAPSDAPALSTALRDQLGLRLDSMRLPVDVVVIDRVSPPTEN